MDQGRNRHDLDSILRRYSARIEFTSPFAVKIPGDRSGTIKGIDGLRQYFQKGLEIYPGLEFELLQVLTGVNSVTLYYKYYKSVKDMPAAEVMILDEEGKIEKVAARYSQVK